MPVATPDKPISQAELTGAIRLAAHESRVATKTMSPAEKANIGAVANFVQQGEQRKAWETLATGFNHVSTWESTAEKQVQTGFDNNGDRVARDASETTNIYDVKALTGVYMDYMVDGYDGLKDTPGGLTSFQKQDLLRDQVETFILSNPAIHEALKDPVTGSLNGATYEGILRNREFMSRLAERLNGVYDSSHLPTDLEVKLVAAESRYQRLDTEIKHLTQEGTDVSIQYKRVDGEKKAFESDAYASRTTSRTTREEAYKTLSIDPDIQIYASAQQRLVEIDASIKRGENKFSIKDKSDAEATVSRTRSQVATKSPDKVTEFDELFRDRTAVNIELSEISTKLINVQRELQTRQGEMTGAKLEKDNLSLQRKAKAQEFTAAIKDAVRLTAQEHLYQRAREIVNKFPSYKAEVEKEFQEEVDGKLEAHVKDRWVTQEEKGKLYGLLGKETVYVFDRNKTQEDVDEIINTGDVDGYIKRVLRESGLKIDQITRLMQDKNFIKAQRSSLVTKLLTSHVAAGGKISEGMQSMLRVTSWGKEVSLSMLNGNEEAKKAVEKITGKPLSEDSLEEVHKKRGGKIFFMILLMALGAASFLSKDLK